MALRQYGEPGSRLRTHAKARRTAHGDGAELAMAAEATAQLRNRLRDRRLDWITRGARDRMARRFEVNITDASLTFTSQQAQIDADAALDQLFVPRADGTRMRPASGRTEPQPGMCFNMSSPIRGLLFIQSR